MIGFIDYNRDELIEKISKISIEKIGSQVITKYDDRVINTTNVSERYEVFDISKYLINKILDIEKNFKITKYKFTLTRGRQYLELISDKVTIGGVDFYKSFYILNSSDKSRRLSFNIGLYSDTSKFYIISSVSNNGLVKKHLKGVTEAAELASVGLNDETFEQQIESFNSIIGHRVSLSKLRDIILGEHKMTLGIDHKKFDSFKNSIRFAAMDGQLKLTNQQLDLLFRSSSTIIEIKKEEDFYLDAFWSLQVYLRIFNKQDSHIIRNETDKIMKITQCSIRNNILESLGI